MIRLALYKGKGNIEDRLIRWWTGSLYSHCELVLEDGTFVSSSPRDGGVRAKVIDQDPEVWDFVGLPWVTKDEVEALLIAEAGTPYDWFGVLVNQVFGFAYQSKRTWFCSEFCAAAMGFDRPFRYSPGDLAAFLPRLAQLMGDRTTSG